MAGHSTAGHITAGQSTAGQSDSARPTAGSLAFGPVTVTPIADGVGVEQVGEILTRRSVPEAWQCHPELFGADGRWELPLGGFLVRSGDACVLVDTGVGPGDNGAYVGGGLLDSLAEHGVAPADVTDVVFTHLHFDHTGWASVDGVPTFPNATYRVHRADWQHFVVDGDGTGDGPAGEAERARLRAIEPQLELFDTAFEVAPGLTAVPTPGHTPGSTVYVVSSDGRTALLLGDVAHSPVQLVERDWTVIWDVDPEQASRARNEIADNAVTSGDLVVGAHFPGMRFGHVVRDTDGRRFVPAENRG